MGRVHKARIITFLIVGSIIFMMQGCSLWKWKDEQIRPYKQFVYNYDQPKRLLIPNDKARHLKLPSPKTKTFHNEVRASSHYYSANGNVCRILNISGSEVACVVSGQWQSSPAVLASSLLK